MTDDVDRDYRTFRSRLARFLWNSESTDEDVWTRDQADYLGRADLILADEYGYMAAAERWRTLLVPALSAAYRVEFDLIDAEVRIRDLDPIMAKIRESGTATILWSGSKDTPIAIEIGLKVGPDEIAGDLWDLHAVVGELEAELSSYTSKAHLGKPVRVLETS